MNKNEYDFRGWATKNNLRCSDGRTIRKDAFKHNDGNTVPLVWNHRHNEVHDVLGHALLENRNEGVYAYCKFNDTQAGHDAKKLVEHGDITHLSIYANRLRQNGGDVLHGEIREVSLVLAGANPGACIEHVALAHGEFNDEEGVIYTDESIELYHADENQNDGEETIGDILKTLSEKQLTAAYAIIGMAIESKGAKHGDMYYDDAVVHAEGEETIGDIFNTFSEKQKNAVYAIIGQALEDGEIEHNDSEIEGGNQSMKHNVFDRQEVTRQDYLTHDDEMAILQLAKSSNVGSFQAALECFADENGLQHDGVSGFVQDTETAGNITEIFPEYKDVKPGAPELITNDQGWISTVLSKVHKSPISRIRTKYVDIRNMEALRAKGYNKGQRKTIVGNIALAKRTTDPQTVYVKSELHRDDIIDITDFDYVNYLYNIDKMSLNEELATAIMLGDGREPGSEGKIEEAHIRSIWNDDELYTMHVDLDIEAARAELQGTNTGANFGENYITAEAMINTVLYAREKFKGTGTPDLYCTPHMVNVMLLARDLNGRRIYSSRAELASALNVGSIITCEQFAGKKRSVGGGKSKELVCIICNLADYSLGSTKGGQITHFTQFDIDFNKEKSLLETRVSGALTKLFSAIAIEKPAVSDSQLAE